MHPASCVATQIPTPALRISGSDTVPRPRPFRSVIADFAGANLVDRHPQVAVVLNCVQAEIKMSIEKEHS